MASIVIQLELEKETKNTVKYHAPAEFPPVEALYINKRDLRAAGAVSAWPSTISVLITFDIGG